MTRYRIESSALNEVATARAGLFAAAPYFEPPRDLRHAAASGFAGLTVYGVIILVIAAFV